MAVGADNVSNGPFEIKSPLHWNSNSSIRRAYAFTYRYGFPEPATFSLNSNEFIWNASNQIGDEMPTEVVDVTAIHSIDITDLFEIDDDTLEILFDFQTNLGLNWGYWGVYVLILYENPNITQSVCTKIYTATQPQGPPQSYNLNISNYDLGTPVLLSIHSGRISQFQNDASVLQLNNTELGTFWGEDLTVPPNIGVQGHFYYENSTPTGLNGDTANSTFNHHDGIAIINEYLNPENPQSLTVYREQLGPGNVHASFVFTYTPDCNFLPDLSNMPRTYSLCRGESIELEAAEGYNNYSWSTSLGTSNGLNDSTLANPTCTADTSLWYTVRMWNDDEEGCSQTIPVFVEVNTVPVPQNIEISPSVCPGATGEIAIINPAGPGSFTYSIDGVVQLSNVFDELAAGSYEIAVNSAQGCVWASTITVPLNPTQETDFTPNPSSGFSPLEVFFDNRSTGASDYLWLIDGEEISSSENLLYTFPDSGSFEISLIAFLNEENCADTATFTLRVDQGIEIMLPNIITPNGDGRNDKLVAMLKGVETCQWVVYNRWGVEVYAGASPKLSGLSNLQTVNDLGFAELQLWEPQAENPDGIYTVVFQAQGIKGQSEEMVFSLTVGR